MDENKAVQAIRNWENELILFDDVDLTTIVEVTKGDQKYPITHIIRSANCKTFLEIHSEIRQVQAAANNRIKAHDGKVHVFSGCCRHSCSGSSIKSLEGIRCE